MPPPPPSPPQEVERHLSLVRYDASLAYIERGMMDLVRQRCKLFNQRFPEIIVIATEFDPRMAHVARVSAWLGVKCAYPETPHALKPHMP